VWNRLPTPEDAAKAALGHPEARDTSVVTMSLSPEGDYGVVLVLDNLGVSPTLIPRPWVVYVARDSDGWEPDGQAWGRDLWQLSERYYDSGHVGVTVIFDPAPAWANEAHLRVGETVETVPVVEGWYLYCQWDTPPPTEDRVLPKVCGFT
jgi:hypothetical protein